MERKLETPGVRAALLSCALLAGALDAQSVGSRLRRVSSPLEPRDERALLTANGARIGAWSVAAVAASSVTPSRTEMLLRPERGPEIVAPRLQHWLGSTDGRTLAGVGQPEALEHPFELQLVVYRDGLRVAAPAERFATESELTVGADGTVALVGHAPGRRGEPFALVLGPDGTTLYRHALPSGTLARDPELFGNRLLVRTHGLLSEGVDGAIHALDARGARLLTEAPGALTLVGFPAAEAALVLTRAALRWVDARDGHERWSQALALRPAGAHAFELWSTPARDALAIVTAGLPRAGEPGAALWLFDARAGTRLERVELGALRSPADVHLAARGAELILERDDTREVFTWPR